MLCTISVDDSLIQQLVSAGPDAGNATAEAIIASGNTGIKSLNKTATDIKKVAGNIGVLGAKAMKNAGTKLGNGLLDGFISQQDELIAAATALGDSIGKAMGISASDRLKLTIAEAGAAGFILTEAEKLAIDPNYKKKVYVKPAEKLPSVANQSMPSFVSPFSAGTPGAGLLGGYTLMESENIANPFNNETQAKGFELFNKNREIANAYNISINVAPGASPAQVGDALVKSIQAYERSKGTGWRSTN